MLIEGPSRRAQCNTYVHVVPSSWCFEENLQITLNTKRGPTGIRTRDPLQSQGINPKASILPLDHWASAQTTFSLSHIFLHKTLSDSVEVTTSLRPQDGDTEESEKDSQDEVIIKNDSIIDKTPRGKKIGSELLVFVTFCGGSEPPVSCHDWRKRCEEACISTCPVSSYLHSDCP